ncbi:hypothetical protein PDESU_05101 [Pontiella desulfatans]|uniref:HEAT repeat domain-containing protein n=1 Tax=Pontiella desulfatans TaxID=2750659 RepID=A0A6C2U8X6_PONDE|nr:HEAT repeat domain-containing protein [Pontiella desulfatans]VGO16510.1 hypothetical protein PDESU_05101 [Pontiella desulfatans]
MKSPMLPSDHQAARKRALELGRSGSPEALNELRVLLSTPSNDVQRLAASAIGKLAEFGVDAKRAVAALAPLAKEARHPQTQQYAIRALVKFGARAAGYQRRWNLKRKMADFLIEATAEELGLELATRNAKDFRQAMTVVPYEL